MDQHLTDAAKTMPSAAAYFREGNAHRDARQYALAVTSYDRAIALDADFAPAYSQRGHCLLSLGQRGPALASCAQATVLRPDAAAGWASLGRLFDRVKAPELALKAYRTALLLAPDRADLPGRVLQQQMLCCDWDGIDALVESIERRLEAGVDAVHLFFWQAISDSPHSLLLAAQNHDRSSRAIVADEAPFAPPLPDGRIRIGYVSGELNLAPNGLVMAGVFDHHDRSGFEIIAFDNGHDDGTELRQRIVGTFDRVVDVRAMSDAAMASAIRDAGIDILVNLNGFFGNARSDVFRHHPAPVQVNYLGCPGTMGGFEMDYAIGDATVIPDSERCFYTEKIVHLLDSYYPTDRARPISDRSFSRAECDLPATGFVFCCFNTAHKILPATFARWMHILLGVQGSVLWLLDSHAVATANLRTEAARHGIDPARLIFAPLMSPDEHLARLRCADLFLDTLPYNAHTTATDALWSGLPVLTCMGTTFPGRVAASVLRAMDLPELVTHSPDEYVRRAIELATRPGELEKIRAKLATNRLTTALFDTVRFTRGMEAAYREMHRRRCAGLEPDHFAVGIARMRGTEPLKLG